MCFRITVYRIQTETTGIIFSLGTDSLVHNVVDEAKLNFTDKIKIFQLYSAVF